MSGRNGTAPATSPASPALQRLLGVPQQARLRLGYGLWDDVPALSWIMEDGQLHVRGTHPDSVIAAPPMLGRLLRTVVREDGPGPFQLVEVLPGIDGSLHHYLVIGFAVTVPDGPSRPHLAGVAIDVTRQQQRVDELTHLALVDELTGLYNLRGFQLFAEHELKSARRRKSVTAVVYLDVDGLKQINDRHGHGDGDAALLSAATLLRQVFRECDVIGRLGGDEFAILAADVVGDPEDLSKRLKGASSPEGVSMSVGVASCPPGVNLSLADLVTAADKAMYRNKPRKSRRMLLEAGAAAIRWMSDPTKADLPGTST